MLTHVFRARDRERPTCAGADVATSVLRAMVSVLDLVEPGLERDQRIAALRRELDAGAGRSCHAFDVTASSIDETCNYIIATVRQRQTARLEVAAAVSTVRQAAEALSVRQQALSTALAAAAARLDRAQRVVGDPHAKASVVEALDLLNKLSGESEREQRADRAALAHRLSLAEEQLSVTSQTAWLDPLTGATNRRGFDRALAKQIEEFDPATPVVVAVFDVDRLGDLNERLGQSAGDLALKHVAVAIRGAVRPHDVVARLGDDDFALIAPGLTLQLAQTRLRHVIQAIRSGSLDRCGEALSVRCGAAEFSAGDTPPTLLHRADLALKEAKALTHGSVVTRSAPLIRDLIAPRRPRGGA